MKSTPLELCSSLCKLVNNRQKAKLNLEKMEKSLNLSDDLENWMCNIPSSIRNEVPLINLAIPGSHDSGSYGISRKAKVAPDAEDIVRKIYPFVPCVVRRWAKTQKYCITDQLMNGIRYFDLRLALNERDHRLYFVHGVFCEAINEPFKELCIFLDQHPQEFVILDFQHFYDFDTHHHQELIGCIMKFFSNKLFTRNEDDSNLRQLTLSNAQANGQQLVIIYRNNLNAKNEFFRSYDWPTPWPNATSIANLKDYLEKRLDYRSPDQGFVTQCLLTPDANFILPRFYSSLRKKCAKKVDKQLSEWVKQQTPGKFKDGDKPTANVFLADFVDIRNNNFCKIVVDLNMKLETAIVKC